MEESQLSRITNGVHTLIKKTSASAPIKEIDIVTGNPVYRATGGKGRQRLTHSVSSDKLRLTAQQTYSVPELGHFGVENKIARHAQDQQVVQLRVSQVLHRVRAFESGETLLDKSAPLQTTVFAEGQNDTQAAGFWGTLHVNERDVLSGVRETAPPVLSSADISVEQKVHNWQVRASQEVPLNSLPAQEAAVFTRIKELRGKIKAAKRKIAQSDMVKEIYSITPETIKLKDASMTGSLEFKSPKVKLARDGFHVEVEITPNFVTNTGVLAADIEIAGFTHSKTENDKIHFGTRKLTEAEIAADEKLSDVKNYVSWQTELDHLKQLIKHNYGFTVKAHSEDEAPEAKLPHVHNTPMLSEFARAINELNETAHSNPENQRVCFTDPVTSLVHGELEVRSSTFIPRNHELGAKSKDEIEKEIKKKLLPGTTVIAVQKPTGWHVSAFRIQPKDKQSDDKDAIFALARGHQANLDVISANKEAAQVKDALESTVSKLRAKSESSSAVKLQEVTAQKDGLYVVQGIGGLNDEIAEKITKALTKSVTNGSVITKNGKVLVTHKIAGKDHPDFEKLKLLHLLAVQARAIKTRLRAQNISVGQVV